MITLPNILTQDAKLTADGGAKIQGNAEDFLALLTGALTQKLSSNGGETRLSADADEGLSVQDVQPQAQSLTQWLAQQDIDITDQSDAQGLLRSLASHLQGELPTAKAESGSDKPLAGISEDKPLSEEELSSLSALMAMLPVQSSPQTVSQITSSTTTDNRVIGALTTQLQQSGQPADTQLITPQGAPDTQANADTHLHALANPVQTLEVNSAPSSTTPTATVSPLVQTPQAHTAPTVAIATASVNAPLGSADWQQNVSQQITMFTRQGQHTAELRLHPESLGQVNITLKMDDNLAQIQMVSPHSHVRAALEASLPLLRTQLAENGIQLGESSISSDGFAGQQQADSQSSFTAHREPTINDTQPDEGELIATPNTLHSVARGNNAVDIFA